jgi:preprotein translocase subunit SecY
MSSIKNDGIFRTVVKKVSPFIPQVEKPKKKITLRNKLIWTGIALLIYFTMGQVQLYGIIVDPANDPLAFARVIFAAQQGTLIELGIGPIVTAGLLMQLLKGSDMLKLNFRDPNDRSLFTSATKIVTLIVIVAEGALYGLAVYGGSTPSPGHTGVLISQRI